MKLAISYLFISFLSIIHAYKILYLVPVATKSHLLVFDPLIQELSKRNHHITIVTLYKLSQHQQPNVREILINIGLDSTKTWSADRFSFYGSHIAGQFMRFKHFVAPLCEAYFTHAEVKELLKNGKQFDVVIVNSAFNECALVTAPLLGKTVILHSPAGFFPWILSEVPQLQPPSFVPNVLFPLASRMDFLQRMENAITFLEIKSIMRYDQVSVIQEIVAKHLPQNPSILDAIKSVDFTLTNGDPVTTSPRPAVPTILDVGGMHCRKAGPVPKEFEDFIETSGDSGFILFSLGSVSQSSDMPTTTVKSLLEAFARLKQNVIWKYEEELENKPKNVKISKWLPQKDLLGHPKIRLFITHGGLLSLQESIYNGVPVVAVPLFADQPGNVARMEEIGVGVNLALSNISGDSMYDAVNKVLGDKSYAENMKKYSVIFHDFVENQAEKAAYWVEYVIRHGGAHHLRISGENLNFFQYFVLDVIYFWFFILFFVIWFVFTCGKSAWNKVK